MAGKDNQESGTNPGHTKDLRRKKRIKYSLYLLAFVVFQVAVITIFVLTIMKLRTPQFRVSSATFEFLNTTGAAAAPSFKWKMFARLEVKNANFGKYEYEDTAVEFLYGGGRIGEVGIPESGVGWRSSDEVNVEVNLSSANVAAGSGSELGADLGIGLLRISSGSEMKGKVKLVFVFSRERSVRMDCDMDVSIPTQQLVNISCK